MVCNKFNWRVTKLTNRTMCNRYKIFLVLLYIVSTADQKLIRNRNWKSTYEGNIIVEERIPSFYSYSPKLDTIWYHQHYKGVYVTGDMRTLPLLPEDNTQQASIAELCCMCGAAFEWWWRASNTNLLAANRRQCHPDLGSKSKEDLFLSYNNYTICQCDLS